MRALLFAALLLPMQAHAAKILFELGGKQQLVEVGQGGGVTPEADVLWDERKDGAYPVGAPTGYADRVVDGGGRVTLVQNPAKKTAFDAAAAAVAAQDAQKAQDKIDFQALKDKINAATAAEIRRAFKFLLKRLGE